MSRLRVAIDFRVAETRQGVGMTVLSLAQGLSRLVARGLDRGREHDQDYIFIVQEGAVAWLKPHLGANCSVVGVPMAPSPRAGRAKRLVRALPGSRALWHALGGSRPAPPIEDDLAEKLGCDLIHFPSQTAHATRLPNIYHPWDLQHLHLPAFFSKPDFAARELHYRFYCAQATVVCVATEWGRQDLIARYGLAPGKIKIVRCGTPLDGEPCPSREAAVELLRQFALPESFLLYPAITWPHKNHANLLRGLALLKQQTGAAPHLCLTGKPAGTDAALRKLARRLGIEREVQFLGFVSPAQLRALYRLATAMVFPSRFEGLGLPVLEAFGAGLPVACAAATVLPEVAGEAAVYFDPESPAAIAATIRKLLESPETRQHIVARGRDVLKQYSSDAAAEQFVRLYGRIAGRASSPLAGAWQQTPRLVETRHQGVEPRGLS